MKITFGQTKSIFAVGMASVVLALMYSLGIDTGSLMLPILVLTYVVFHVSASDEAKDLLSPLSILPFILFLYSFGSYQYLLENHEMYLHFERFSVTEETIKLFALCANLGLLGLAAASVIPMRSVRDAPVYTISSLVSLNMLIASAGIIAFIISAILGGKPFISRIFPWDIQSYAVTAFETRLEIEADPAGSIIEVLLFMPAITLLVLASSITLCRRDANIVGKVAGLAFLLSFALTSLLAGFRFWLFYEVVLFVVVFHYVRAHIRPLLAVTGAVFVYALLNFLSVVRSVEDISDLYTFAVETVTVDRLFQIAQSSELQGGNTLVRLIDGVSIGETDFNYGLQLFHEIGAYVPRILWADRPKTIAETYALIFNPQIFEAGGGFGSFILNEAYWVGGLIILPVYMFVVGILLRLIYRYLHPYTSVISLVLYPIVLYFLCIGAVRSGFWGSMKSAIMFSLPIIIIYLFRKFSVTRNHGLM